MSGWEARTINIVSEELVGSLKVIFTFGEGNLARPVAQSKNVTEKPARWGRVPPDGVEFRPFTRATVRACCSRTSS